MAYKYDIQLEGAAEKAGHFKGLNFRMQNEVGDTIAEQGEKVSLSAVGRVNRHPSGLWRKAGSPRYPVKRKSALSVIVQTPGGAVGKAEAISEFAADYKTGQGRNLVNVLTSTYGRPGGSGGGRILYAAYDDLAPSIESAVANKALEVANG